MSERTVGLGHAVHVFLALECAALLVERVDDLGRQLVGHRLSAALACVVDEIFH